MRHKFLVLTVKMVKIGLHLRKLLSQNYGVSLFGPPGIDKMLQLCKRMQYDRLSQQQLGFSLLLQ